MPQAPPLEGTKLGLLHFFYIMPHYWVRFALWPVYCYLEFKLPYLKNLKMFSIRIEDLFEPISCKEKLIPNFHEIASNSHIHARS